MFAVRRLFNPARSTMFITLNKFIAINASNAGSAVGRVKMLDLSAKTLDLSAKTLDLSAKLVARSFSNRAHSSVISTPPQTPVGFATKVIHCSVLLIVWILPIAYFFAMLSTYQEGRLF